VALNGLLDIELSVKNPAELGAFWGRHGFVQTSDGVYGTNERNVVLTIAEGDHRHLSAMHFSCATESDIFDIAKRLEDLGIASQTTSTSLDCSDPVLGHRIRIDVGAPGPLAKPAARADNRPGERTRWNSRAASIDPSTRRPPRRLGHVVLASPRIEKSTAFYFDGLGFRVSDQFAGANATFGRVETDHHNLLIHRSRVGYLNHYALEVDDFDAVGENGTAVLAERPDAHIVGVGRHLVGSNIFWYLRDPSGSMFEFFADMDHINDDDLWAKNVGRTDWGSPNSPAPVEAWGPHPTELFTAVPDIDEIARARERRGLP
jgi:catechol 2,3-dioxygenase-like lactoylglutathione lyase family enzyme